MSNFFSLNTIVSFMDVSVGDHLDGVKIDALLLNNRDYLIYYAGNELKYSSTDNSNIAISKLNQLELLRTKAYNKFGYIYVDAMDGHVISILSLIFSTGCLEAGDLESIDAELEKLSSYIDSLREPILIIGSNKDYSVYIDHDKQVKHRLRNLQLYNSDVVDEFYKLRAWGAVAVHSSRVKFLNLKLATCLTIGLRSKLKGDDIDPSEAFRPVHAYIEKTVNSVAAYYLILFVTLASIGVMLGSGMIYKLYSTPLTPNLNVFLIGLFGGVCGALISVLQRAQKLQISLYENNGTIVLQGIVRVGLGCAFGVIALIACKAGLLLNLMSESNSRLLILAIIAGFSERLVPDFIEKTSNEKSSK